MNIKFKNANDSPERNAKIKEVLPKETIISTVLEPDIERTLFKTLAKCIRQELEIYRAYPKNSRLSPYEIESPKEMQNTFDPRTNEKCFMGKAFRSNSEAQDSELVDYRKAIGTIKHPVWGDCTLLEIWGGDHFEDYSEMVLGAFKYGMNMSDVCPKVIVYTNPLFQNKKSKQFKLSPAQQQYKDDMEVLLAKAMIFGVREPKESMKSRRKSR